MDEQKEIIKSSSENKKSNNEFEEVESMPIDKGPKVNTESNTESYFDGSMLELMAYSYLCGFITAITAGVARPWGLCILNNYIYSHTVISGKRLKFEGKADDLFANCFKWNIFKIITLGIYSIWSPTRYKEWEVSKLHFEDEKLIEGDSYFTGSVGSYFLVILLTRLLTIISFGLLSPVSHVIRLKWELEHTVVNRKVVIFNGSAGEFFIKKIGWLLLGAITFGIYTLWIPAKTLRWQVSNTFLLRKGSNLNNASSSGNVTINASNVKENKKTNKIALFTVLGIVLIIVIILIVKIASIFRPMDSVIEEEMRSTINLAKTEFTTITENPLEGSNKNIGKVKKLNLNSLNEFVENGGKGYYSDFYLDYIDYDEYGNIYDYRSRLYASTDITLIKKSTICTGRINTYISDETKIECMSIKDYLQSKIKRYQRELFSSS